MDCERFDFEKFAEMVAFQASEERLDRCIEALERRGYADAADIIRGEGLLPKRVQYKEAVQFYEDLTPPEETERIALQSASFYSGKRLSKIGRPTKKERGDLDDFTDNN